MWIVYYLSRFYIPIKFCQYSTREKTEGAGTLNLNRTREKRKVIDYYDLRIEPTPNARCPTLATHLYNSKFGRYSHLDIPQMLDEDTQPTKKLAISTVSNKKHSILKKFSICKNWGLGMGRKGKQKKVRFGSREKL